MANMLAAGEDNFELQSVPEKSSILSWLKRQPSTERYTVSEGDFRPIHLSKRIFVAQPLKSLTVNHNENTVKVLQGWITDPNGVLPESLALAKIEELSSSAKCNKYVPNTWIKEVFYEIRPLKHIPGDGHFIYIIQFYTNLKTISERGNMNSTRKSTDKTESFSTSLNNRFSPKTSVDVPPSTNIFNRTVSAPLSVGFTSVKMCSVNAESRCSKAHCLASKYGPDGSKSPANLQSHFDMLIKNIFNGAFLAEPRIARALGKEFDSQTKTVNDNSLFRKKRGMLLSKSFELGDGQVDSVVEMLDSMVRKTSLTKAESEESGNCVLTDEVVGEPGCCFRKETDSGACDILELKTCTPSTNLISEPALHSSFSTVPEDNHFVLAGKSSSNNYRCPNVISPGTDSEKSSSVATGHPDLSVVSKYSDRVTMQASHSSTAMNGPACQSLLDRQSQDHVVSVGVQYQAGGSQDLIPNIKPPIDYEISKTDIPKAVPNQISIPMSPPTNLMVLQKCSVQNSNRDLCTPPPVILTRKTISGENFPLSSDSSTCDNNDSSFHTDSTKQTKTRMFSCCTGKA